MSAEYKDVDALGRDDNLTATASVNEKLPKTVDEFGGGIFRNGDSILTHIYVR